MKQQLYIQLSERERQVANLLQQGLSNKLIAQQLFICERTVKFHCGNIYQKCKVLNRMAFVLKLTSLPQTTNPSEAKLYSGTGDKIY